MLLILPSATTTLTVKMLLIVVWVSSGWNDTRILRRLLPPSQPTGAVWETALRLPMQEGYSHILLEHGIPSGQPWGGVLLESTELTVSSFTTVCIYGTASAMRKLHQMS